MKLYWRKKEELAKTRNEFDADQAEAIFGYCAMSFFLGLMTTAILSIISTFLREHLIWSWI